AHEPVSPNIMEGFYTRFGAASIARGQLLVSTDELRRKLDAGVVVYDALSTEQHNLLRVRELFDESGIEQSYDVNSPAYEAPFHELIRQAGYQAVVGMKSPNDLGRTGVVEIYNKLSEQWSQSIPVICLNTADERTWRNWIAQQMPLFDYDGAYSSQMSWLFDLSNEAISEGATAFDARNNVSGFIRYIDTTSEQRIEVSFPENLRLTSEFHPSMRAVAETISTVLSGVSTVDITTVIEQLPATFEHQFGEGIRETELNKDSYISYLVYELGRRQGLELPFFYGNDFEDLESAMWQANHLEEKRNGLPLGGMLIHTFFKELSLAGFLNKQVVTSHNVPDTIQPGIFFVESFPEGGLINGSQGVLYRTSSNDLMCDFITAEGEHRQMSLSQVWTDQIDREPMGRVIVLHA
ncbi:MAG: hypothetical protein M3Q81_02950, partial [bacterium]|nr:hypothetical protein [bacterium]